MARPQAPAGGHDLTRAHEDYLEAIYVLTQEGAADEGVRSVDVAERLGVSKASVNKALAGLKEGGYVDQRPYGRVTLTEDGNAYAAIVWRAHRMLRTFLERDLGVEPSVADAEACLMEHVLSPDTLERWTSYLEGQGIGVAD